MTNNQLKTKYNIGDEVWFMTNNKPRKTTVERVIISRESISYEVKRAPGVPGFLLEDELFPTKEDLLKSL